MKHVRVYRSLGIEFSYFFSCGRTLEEGSELASLNSNGRLDNLKLMTFNVAMNKRPAELADALADLIAKLQVDVIALQEVSNYTDDGSQFNFEQYLQDALRKKHGISMNVHFAKARNDTKQGSRKPFFGQAILSRYEFVDKVAEVSPMSDANLNRVMQLVKIQLPGGDRLAMANIHPTPDIPERFGDAHKIYYRRFMDSWDGKSPSIYSKHFSLEKNVIITGDTNSAREREYGYLMMVNGAPNNPVKHIDLCLDYSPDLRCRWSEIDYFLKREGAEWHTKVSYSLPEFNNSPLGPLSDHSPIFLELQRSPQPVGPTSQAHLDRLKGLLKHPDAKLVPVYNLSANKYLNKTCNRGSRCLNNILVLESEINKVQGLGFGFWGIGGSTKKNLLLAYLQMSMLRNRQWEN